MEQESPDFVLLDFNMPGKDGLTLAEELRSLDPQLHVAVISANHQVEVVNRAQAAGACFFASRSLNKRSAVPDDALEANQARS